MGNQVNLRSSNSVSKFYYCDIEDGETGFGGYPPAVYEECIKSDPLFDNDYYLTLGSPCIDKGDPTMFDPDGTRCDIGAFFFDQTGIDIRSQKCGLDRLWYTWQRNLHAGERITSSRGVHCEF